MEQQLFDGDNMVLGAKRPTLQDALDLIEIRSSVKGVSPPKDDEAVPAFLDAFRYLQTDPTTREKIIRALVEAVDARKATHKAVRSLRFMSLLVTNSKMVAKAAFLANFKKSMADGKIKSSWLSSMHLEKFLNMKRSTEEALEYTCVLANAFADDVDITLFVPKTYKVHMEAGRLEHRA